MKHARNLFLALALLVLLYGGAYRIFFREPVRDSMLWGDWHLSDFEKRWHKFFAPAGEVDLRLTFDRPRRNYLRGHWINADNGDFVTISGNDTCTFQIGELRSSGKATFRRAVGGYYLEFQDGSLTRYLAFVEDGPRKFKGPQDFAGAKIGILDKTSRESNASMNFLTRAPDPAP